MFFLFLLIFIIILKLCKSIADYFECDFSLTESDFKTAVGHNDSSQPFASPEDAKIKKTYRVVVVKPLVPLDQLGISLARTLGMFQIKDISKQLVVIFEDPSTLPGSIQIQGIFFF